MPYLYPSLRHLTVDDDIEAVRRRLVGKLVNQTGSVGIVQSVTIYAEQYGHLSMPEEGNKLVMNVQMLDMTRPVGRFIIESIEVWGE